MIIVTIKICYKPVSIVSCALYLVFTSYFKHPDLWKLWSTDAVTVQFWISKCNITGSVLNLDYHLWIIYFFWWKYWCYDFLYLYYPYIDPIKGHYLIYSQNYSDYIRPPIACKYIRKILYLRALIQIILKHEKDKVSLYCYLSCLPEDILKIISLQ